jgi:hypothetical protein
MIRWRNKPYHAAFDEWFEQRFAGTLPFNSHDECTGNCPGDAYLRLFLALTKPSLFDSQTLHVLECSWCLHRLAALREEQAPKRGMEAPPSSALLLSAMLLAGVVAVALFQVGAGGEP